MVRHGGPGKPGAKGLFFDIERKTVINYFGPEMYKALGLPPGQLLLVQGIYGAVGPITNFL